MIGMVTGLTPPTSGDCFIAGHSIVTETQHARGSLGYCPQSNVMYGRLTVIEHLQIYAAIKGIPGGGWSHAATRAAEEMIQVCFLFKHFKLRFALCQASDNAGNAEE